MNPRKISSRKEKEILKVAQKNTGIPVTFSLEISEGLRDSSMYVMLHGA